MSPSAPIAPNAASHPIRRTVGTGYLFGLPVGDLGWFATLLVSTAAGFASFFATTFFGIVGLLIDNIVTHRTPDYAISYRLVGFPIGVIVLVLSLFYLSFLRIRRMLRKA